MEAPERVRGRQRGEPERGDPVGSSLGLPVPAGPRWNRAARPGEAIRRGGDESPERIDRPTDGTRASTRTRTTRATPRASGPLGRHRLVIQTARSFSSGRIVFAALRGYSRRRSNPIRVPSKPRAPWPLVDARTARSAPTVGTAPPRCRPRRLYPSRMLPDASGESPRGRRRRRGTRREQTARGRKASARPSR